jgi:uncharacterized protein YpiB (UPF0302 family)
MVCSEENTCNLKTGTVCSIDIYGNVKVKMQENEMVLRFRREDLKLLFKKYNSTHYMDYNPAFINYLKSKYRVQSDPFLRIEQLKQLIDMALDMNDIHWFMDLSNELKNISRMLD